MNKRISLSDLDIPIDDIDCWNRYPKYRWVYESSRLYDSQNLKWSPYETEEYNYRELNIDLYSKDAVIKQPGFIFVKESQEKIKTLEIFIIKGEIKYTREIDLLNKTHILENNGEIDLRINAFVTLYFSKFTGIISVEIQGKDIIKVKLRPMSDLSLETNMEVIKLIKRMYKKFDFNVIGPTDQSLHETLAS